MKVTVLGIDPGFANIGLMSIQLQGRKSKALATFSIETKKPPKKRRTLREADDDVRRLEEIEDRFRVIMEEVNPDIVAMERVPRLKNASATRQCALAWGAMHAICRNGKIPVLIYDTDVIKKRVTGDKQASKVKMVNALKKIFPRFKDWPEGKRVEHVADAGGAALCAENDPAVELLMRVAKASG
jgi:crossover junction endodeoxyribonuclease RuvC